MMKRDLTLWEKMLIARVAEKLDAAGNAQLLADMENATAEALNDDSSRVAFDIRVEPRMIDSDGTEITVLLHADQNNPRVYRDHLRDRYIRAAQSRVREHRRQDL
jgi:hypothetical protein